MKKVKLNGKLSFNKETVTTLNKEQMNKVVGGSGTSNPACCATGQGATQTYTSQQDCCTYSNASFCC